MTLDTLLSLALDGAFIAVFALTFVDWLRHRGRIRLAVMLVFASTAIVLGAPLIRIVLPGLGAVFAVLTGPALLAQPVLALWLVSHIRRVPRGVMAASLAAFVALTAGIFLLAAAGAESGSVGRIVYAIAGLAYFALVDGAAAVGFALAARARAGAARSRLMTAAVATALLGLAVIVLLGGAVVTTPGSQGAMTGAVLVRVVGLLSALGYIAAFAPPRALRRISQQSIAYDFIRELNSLPSGTPIGRIWALLGETVQRASGATRVEVVGGANGEAPDLPEAKVGPQRRERRIAMPIHSQRWASSRLELDLPEHQLFLEDDLELTRLLLDRTTRAAERETFIVERERLIAELQAASAAKSDFLAAMSHELRTPLNAIIGFSELLSEGGDEAADAATVTSYAEHIHASGLHLLELVNDVLDLARVEAGRLDLKTVQVELDVLVRQTVASLQPLADQKQHTVTLQLAPMAVEADPARVRQIVVNLLSNAIKFTEPGGEIRLSLRLDDAGLATLQVADTGRGIAPADMERIFEAFQQGAAEGHPGQHEGTGLGLALTRQLVEAHGGSVTVRSEPGSGSEFTVTLPRQRPAIDESERAPAFPSGKPSVLVIEDDEAARELLRVHLEGAGYAVLSTASGRQGLAWVAEARPDAVLLDIRLPDIDGWEILQRLKADPQTRAIPVMVVSIVDDRQLGLALGAVDYFVKPISREPLLEAIGRLTFTTKVQSRTVTALVIDGDPEAPQRYRQLMEPDGFRVISAPDGATGRRRATEEQPDLILLDSQLPDGDGFELAASLRHDPVTAAIPVWLTTPEGLPPEARARLNGNIQGVLVRGEDALTAMHGWLEASRIAIEASAGALPAAQFAAAADAEQRDETAGPVGPPPASGPFVAPARPG